MSHIICIKKFRAKCLIHKMDYYKMDRPWISGENLINLNFIR